MTASATDSRSNSAEPHEVLIGEFPKQPSRKDGLSTTCAEHWRAHAKSLREARMVAEVAIAEATATVDDAA